MKLKKIGLFSLVLLAFLASCNTPLSLADIFRSMGDLFPSRNIERSEQVFEFGSNPRELDITYQYHGKNYSLDDLFRRTATTGFIVVKDDSIVYEQYFRGGCEDSLFTSWSVTKSFLSALIGIAIDEGLIDSVNDPITKYVPELKDTGYNNVPIKHILQMSSGVDFDETYNDLSSDIYVMLEKVFFFKQPAENTILKLKSERPSGESFHYASSDTQVLGMLLSHVTGKTVAAYLEEKIWRPLGMESHANWNIDDAGVELAFCCLNATLRDYARFGRLYLNKGNWNGVQIVSEQWVLESVVPDQPHLQPGMTEDGWGYQYQWWIPEESDGEFLACGVYGQYIYIHPKENLVIVKTSADPRMADDESVAAFRAIADQL